ncbi:holin [Microbacterium rhizophilus]|uniref:holin n=1 Tax=Microbacterium rhizophilus TaxID=3138934 RepID=UPI0031E77788
MSKLTDATWWRAALLRALYTALMIAVPYLGGTLITAVPWLTILSAGALGFITSLLTSLAGLPETVGVDLPWWLAMLERTAKTFAQALVSGYVGATLLTDVDWAVVLQFAALSTLGTLLRLILATLPADPTAGPARTVNQTFILPPDASGGVLPVAGGATTKYLGLDESGRIVAVTNEDPPKP